MRDEVSFRQLSATALAGMAAPLILLGARLHWRWVLVALLASAIYYYIMYKIRTRQPLTKRLVSSQTGSVLLCLTAVWLLWLAGFMADKSVLSFPQTANQPLTGLLLLGLAAWAAQGGIRTVVRCGAVLLPVLAVLFGIVLMFSVPGVSLAQLKPYGDWTQAATLFAVLTLPTLCLYIPPENGLGKPAPWILAGGLLTLAASVITAGCLSAPVAAKPMSFYTLAQSVSLFGTMERFEALSSAACLAGYFCLLAFLLCIANKLLSALFPKIPAWLLWLLAAVSALVSNEVSVAFAAVTASIFCAVFPLLTQAIGGRKKV